MKQREQFALGDYVFLPQSQHRPRSECAPIDEANRCIAPTDQLVSACLAALFLRGFAKSILPNSIWPIVRDAILLSAGKMPEAVTYLQRKGNWHAAAALDDQQLIDSALLLVERNRVLTAHDLAYPSKWLATLGSVAPAALWRQGDLPAGRYTGIVGSRQLTSPQGTATQECASVIASWGNILVTGGAIGADSVALETFSQLVGAQGCVTIHPCGLARINQPDQAACHLSLCPPAAPFSGRQAIERNQLIYAAGEVTIVTAARFRQGGSWGGAIHALRKRLGRVAVLDWEDETSRSLGHLGGILISPTDIATGLAFARSHPVPTPQPSLFGDQIVREGSVDPFLAPHYSA